MAMGSFVMAHNLLPFCLLFVEAVIHGTRITKHETIGLIAVGSGTVFYKAGILHSGATSCIGAKLLLASVEHVVTKHLFKRLDVALGCLYSTIAIHNATSPLAVLGILLSLGGFVLQKSRHRQNKWRSCIGSRRVHVSGRV